MAVVNSIEMSKEEICNLMNSESYRDFTANILDTFTDNGLTYKVSKTKRIYCYIKKSKEALIINPNSYSDGEYSIQLRIKNAETFAKLESLTENVRNQILFNSGNCKMPGCWGCNTEYVFEYAGSEYRKCSMLCDNFHFSKLEKDDFKCILAMIKDEIIFGKPKKRGGKNNGQDKKRTANGRYGNRFKKNFGG